MSLVRPLKIKFGKNSAYICIVYKVYKLENSTTLLCTKRAMTVVVLIDWSVIKYLKFNLHFIV